MNWLVKEEPTHYAHPPAREVVTPLRASPSDSTIRHTASANALDFE